jgi:hypothetical protein
MSAAEEIVPGNVGTDFQHRIFDGEDLVAWNGEVKPWFQKQLGNRPTRATHEEATPEQATPELRTQRPLDPRERPGELQARQVVAGGPDYLREWMLLGTVALVFASVGALLGMRR